MLMNNTIFYLPTKYEIDNLLIKRKKLKPHSDYLQHRLNELENFNITFENKISILSEWSSFLKLTPFEIRLYITYLKLKLNPNNNLYAPLVKFMLTNYYIYYHKIQEYDYYDRFESINEALKWLISYRITKQHFRLKIEEYIKKK